MDIAHVFERSVIHLFCGGSVLLGFLWLAAFLERRGLIGQLRSWAFFAVPSVFAALVIFLREAVDVHRGGWIWKSYIDPVSWLAGMGVAAWALFRLSPRIELAHAQIVSGRQRAERAKANAHSKSDGLSSPPS